MKIAADYLALVNRFPMIRIRSQTHLKAAARMIDELSIIDEQRLTSGEADYLLVLTDLVEKYENEHFPPTVAFEDAAAVLEYLVEQAGMSASDLGRILGHRQLGAALLRRERELSKAHIVKLADYFKVSTDLFLQPSQAEKWRRAS